MSGKDATRELVRPGKNWKNRLALIGGSIAIVGAAVAVRSVWGPAPLEPKRHKARQLSRLTRERARAKLRRRPRPPRLPMAHRRPKPRCALWRWSTPSRSRVTTWRECLLHHGKDVLESLVNKHLIAEHCKRRNIVVTAKEVDLEIDRMAERFSMSADQWLSLLKDERGITPAQYAKDIIWPTLALRKLADTRLQVSKADLQEAYETQFGPGVQVRVIVTSEAKKAQALRAEVMKNPEEFGNIAKEKSEDPGSASAKGMIQPVRKHLGDPTIEQVAFAMREGDISEVIEVKGQFVIMKCEALIAARPVPMEQVEKLLVEAIRDKKLRLAAKDVFEDLQRDSKVETIFNDPQKRAKNPGVAALINGHPISMAELAEECIERHGKESLKGLINHRLVEQACTRRKIQISQTDMDTEVARAALLGAKPKKNGGPDVEAWRKYVTEEQAMTWDVYLHEVVWPEVALKKLAGNKVQITEEDLHKGFEANYGRASASAPSCFRISARRKTSGRNAARFPPSNSWPNVRRNQPARPGRLLRAMSRR